MSAAHVLWWLALAAITVPFLDIVQRTLPGPAGWVRHETRARVVLGLLEIGSVVLWLWLLRGRWALPVGGSVILVAGGVLALAGGALAAWAKVALGPWFSPNLGIRRDHALVTTGPYALVRHPIYLGIILFIAGSALVWTDLGLLVLAAVIGLLLARQARIEERLFADHFGAAHDAYRERTPALLPWPRPRRRPPL